MLKPISALAVLLIASTVVAKPTAKPRTSASPVCRDSLCPPRGTRPCSCRQTKDGQEECFPTQAACEAEAMKAARKN